MITEIKTTLVGLKSKLDEAEYQVSDLKGKIVENTQSEQKKESKK